METIDNLNTLLGDKLKESLNQGSKLRIAASCFSMYAYQALKNELQNVESLEFIFTSPTFSHGESTDRIKKEQREFFIPKLERERSLYGTDFEVKLRNELTQKAIAKECAEWIRNKVTFKSNATKAEMQPMACVNSTEEEPSVFFPFKGFTSVDLGYQKGEAFSNFVTKLSGESMTSQFLSTFNQIWNDPEKVKDVTEEIIQHLSTVYAENSPESIYFVILYNIFNEFLDDVSEDNLPDERTGYENSVVWKTLFNFQRDAAIGLINKIETYNGCILADSVGLGKTFTALAVIKYYELRNKSVLVLCPKKLANNWQTYNRNLKTNILAADRFGYEVLNHTDLQRTSGESYGTPLNQINWGNYDLVVIDESHNFRNATSGDEEKESRYEALMNKVVRAGVRTKVLMLSATPVNNRFADLKNQLALAYEGESHTLQEKLGTENTIEEIFRQAQSAFTRWSKLPAEDRTSDAILSALDFEFFQLLDSVTIARSRKHIQAHYDTSEIGTFPERNIPISLRTPLTERQDVPPFSDIHLSLSSLNLAVYTPASYLLESRRAKYESNYDELEGLSRNISLAGQQQGIRSLMTVNLLKRLESSVHSFRLTLKKFIQSTESSISLIQNHQSGNGQSIRGFETGFDPDAEDLSDSSARAGEFELDDLDLTSWLRDLEADLQLAHDLYTEMQKVTPGHDQKLQHLLTHLQQKVENPINPGNKKILVFTAFADTADYLYEQIADTHLARFGLNTAKITGSSNPKSSLPKHYDFQEVLTLFSPISKSKALILPDEPAEIDLIIATDCISEGQNLQDCDYLINYDIHWNPVRIIQRFGRVDRIGSPNTTIQLVNYWPDIDLDEYINLKERVEDRMVIVDMAGTGSDNPLDPAAQEISYRKEQLRKLQDEVIEMEDIKTGVSITDLGLNDFRMDLVSYMRKHGDIARAPHGMHAVIAAQPEKGLPPGAIYALRNRKEEVNIDKLNRLHPYYLCYVEENGEVFLKHTDVKRVLDLVRFACRGKETPNQELSDSFNQETRDGHQMEQYSDLLDQVIRSIIEVKEEADVDSLFTPGSTSAFVGGINGLDDFELIAFLIVRNQAAHV